MKDVLLLMGIFAFAVFLLFFSLSSVIDDLFKAKFSKIFLEDLKKATKHKVLTPQQVTTLAESRNLDTRYTVLSVKKAIGDLLTAEEDTDKEVQQLESYLSHIKQIEPFEGVPSELRIHLERIKDQLPNLSVLLDPLAIQIKELAAVRSREVKLQKYYTAGGFFVGLIGIAIAIWMYINPPDSSATAAQSVVREEAISGATQGER